MATAAKTGEKTGEKKANPFAKLDAKKGAAKAAPEAEEISAETEREEAVVKPKRAVKPKPAPEPEIEDEEEAEDADVDVEETEDGTEELDNEDGPAAVLAEDDEVDGSAVEGGGGGEGDSADAAPEPVAKKTRRTAAQVEAEAAAREAKLQEQIDALNAKLEGKADSVDVGVVKDRVVLEDGVGGDVRVVGDGRTLVNDDWRATADGLRLLLGRASMQSTQQFQIPLSLVESLAELLSNITEIRP